MKLFSSILRLSPFAIGSAKAHSAIDAATPEAAAAAAALDADKHSLDITLAGAGTVAAATHNLRSSDSSFIIEGNDSPPLLRGPVKEKDSANLANVDAGEVVDPGTVDCVEGKEKSSGKTCYEACNNWVECCGGLKACFGFTGKVAKDKSCMGSYGKMFGDVLL